MTSFRSLATIKFRWIHVTNIAADLNNNYVFDCNQRLMIHMLCFWNQVEPCIMQLRTVQQEGCSSIFDSFSIMTFSMRKKNLNRLVHVSCKSDNRWATYCKFWNCTHYCFVQYECRIISHLVNRLFIRFSIVRWLGMKIFPQTMMTSRIENRRSRINFFHIWLIKQ